MPTEKNDKYRKIAMAEIHFPLAFALFNKYIPNARSNIEPPQPGSVANIMNLLPRLSTIKIATTVPIQLTADNGIAA